MFSLTGKKAIVTGASGDLGYAMAQALHEQGADIVILDISPETSQIAEQLSDEAARVSGIQIDLSDRKALDQAFEEAMQRLGGVDILLNCAGINYRNASENYMPEDWDKVLEVNLSATFFICQRAGRHMIEKKRGKIINIASMTCFTGGMNNCAYVASKAGVAQLTKTLSNEWGKYGINVNAIAPGYMRTKMNSYYFTTSEGEKLREIITSRIPLGRWGMPEDLKGAVVYLASSASDYVSGLILPIDGGFLGR